MKHQRRKINESFKAEQSQQKSKSVGLKLDDLSASDAKFLEQITNWHKKRKTSRETLGDDLHDVDHAYGAQ